VRDILNLYADDSGSRMPDRKQDATSSWFGLGGIIIAEKDEDIVRTRHATLMANFLEIGGKPLHSVKIRKSTGPFTWLLGSPDRAAAFFEELTAFICEAPIVCIAAVIDRLGYRAKYDPIYTPEKRWLLCKTAFSILVERSVKYAISKSHRLRVFVEESDKKTDRTLEGYYHQLRKTGMFFPEPNMAAYAPLRPEDFATTLYDFRKKSKTSELMQLADLCLYPMCIYPSKPEYRSFHDLHRAGKLINCVLKPEDVPSQGIKYSRFDTNPVPPIPPWTPPG
jgi:hypothetical protein